MGSVSAAVLLVTVVIAWIIMAPIQFGGQVAFVIVNGNSMEPLYRQGDLIIVRQAAEYQLSDIVSYHSPDIGLVIHRIIGQQGDRFMLKGDHNTWTDSYLPTQADMIGKAWLHLPGFGLVIGYFRNPWILSYILAVCTGAVFLFKIIPIPGGFRPRPVAQKASNFWNSFLRRWEDCLFVLAAIALAALLLACVAFTRPITRTVLNTISYEQKGVFSYTASGQDNLQVYGSTGLQTGAPIFRRLISKVNFHFDYQVISDSPIEAHGTLSLIALVSSVDGWQQTIEMQPATPFTGSTASIDGIADLDKIQAVLDSLEAQTGIQRTSYTVFVTPQITLNGNIGGQAVSDTFAPPLGFQIDPFEMQLVWPDPKGTDPLYPSMLGLLEQPSTEPNPLSILSLEIQVLAARWISSILLVLALGSLALLGLSAYRSIKIEGEPARIRLKYGPLILRVGYLHPSLPERVVEVETIDDLAQLANKNGHSIMYTTHNRKHLYFVHDTSLVYRYVSPEIDKDNEE